ncbi:MAG: DUF4168 domain-containing protein [Pseudanabaenales cyanobacterium]|nr:DUF4168 domain-containing protein [Pseudanabaenales cyanobacterium]
MNKSSILIIVKQLTSFMGAAGVSALISLSAQAQQLNTVPNNLHDVTAQWTLTKSETTSPESAIQTQDLPEAASAVEEIPASETGSASDLVAPAPETPEAVATPESSSISQAELQQFANAVIEVQTIERQTQESMAQLILAEGLSPERFNEIFLAQQSVGAEPEPEITLEEQQTFEQVLSQLETIDQAAQTSKEQAVIAQGLEVERFDQILAAVRQDPDLQQQVQELLPTAE